MSYNFVNSPNQTHNESPSPHTYPDRSNINLGRSNINLGEPAFLPSNNVSHEPLNEPFSEPFNIGTLFNTSAHPSRIVGDTIFSDNNVYPISPLFEYYKKSKPCTCENIHYFYGQSHYIWDKVYTFLEKRFPQTTFSDGLGDTSSDDCALFSAAASTNQFIFDLICRAYSSAGLIRNSDALFKMLESQQIYPYKLNITLNYTSFHRQLLRQIIHLNPDDYLELFLRLIEKE
jgi:hypothetical protein